MSTRISVGDVAKFIRGITFKPEEKVAVGATDSVVCLRTKNIQETLDESDLIAVPSSLVRDPNRMVRTGDVLVSSANSWELVGKCVRVKNLKYKATAGGFIGIVRPEKVDPDYFYHWMSAPKIQQKIRHLGRQTTNISNLPVDRFLELAIPVPRPDEQKRIAAILDKADVIRCKRQQAIQLADDFIRSVFLEMFGDPVSNLRGYAVGTIRDLVSEVRYGTSTKANTLGEGMPVLRMNNITYAGGWNFADVKHVELENAEVEKYTVQPGDILFNRTNSKELVGKTAVYPEREPMAFAGYLVRARLNDCGNPYYVSAYLNSEHGKKTLVGMCKSIVGMANINAQELQDIPILLPPKEVQDRFANRCLAVERGRRRHEKSALEAAALNAALSDQFFSRGG